MEHQKLSRSEQSRINGANSKGPISIEGKAKSSRNSIKHGFAAVINNVISIEDEAAFQLHVDSYRASMRPQCYVEQTFVDQLASISWRQSRLIALETALIDAQISIQKDNVCDIHPKAGKDPYFHLVLAFQGLSRQAQKTPQDQPADPTAPPEGYTISSIELVRRYLVSYDRQYRNGLLNFHQYRKDFPAAPIEVKDLDEPEIKPEISVAITKTTPKPTPIGQPTTESSKIDKPRTVEPSVQGTSGPPEAQK